MQTLRNTPEWDEYVFLHVISTIYKALNFLLKNSVFCVFPKVLHGLFETVEGNHGLPTSLYWLPAFSILVKSVSPGTGRRRVYAPQLGPWD